MDKFSSSKRTWFSLPTLKPCYLPHMPCVWMYMAHYIKISIILNYSTICIQCQYSTSVSVNALSSYMKMKLTNIFVCSIILSSFSFPTSIYNRLHARYSFHLPRLPSPLSILYQNLVSSQFLLLYSKLGGCTLYYVWELRAFMTPPKNPLIYEWLYV